MEVGVQLHATAALIPAKHPPVFIEEEAGSEPRGEEKIEPQFLGLPPCNFFLICTLGLWVLRPLLAYCTSVG
jgi:hypothetical protein